MKTIFELTDCATSAGTALSVETGGGSCSKLVVAGPEGVMTGSGSSSMIWEVPSFIGSADCAACTKPLVVIGAKNYKRSMSI